MYCKPTIYSHRIDQINESLWQIFLYTKLQKKLYVVGHTSFYAMMDLVPGGR